MTSSTTVTQRLNTLDEKLRMVGDKLSDIIEAISSKYPPAPDCEVGFANYGRKHDLDNVMATLERVNWNITTLVFWMTTQDITPEQDAATATKALERLAAMPVIPVPTSDDADTQLAVETLRYAQQRIASLTAKLKAGA